MKPAEFRRILDRDEFTCYATGDTGTAGLVPQHRKNRGMGGSSLLDTSSNIITFDSIRNGQIEADPWWQTKAKVLGWKVERWDEPLRIPVFSIRDGWFMLDETYGRHPATVEIITAWRREAFERWGQ